MKRRICVRILFYVVIYRWWFDFALAETTTQSITLHPGWNAVFLEVQPQSTAPAAVFAGVTNPQSVRKWYLDTSIVEFIQGPDLPVPLGTNRKYRIAS